MDVSKEIRQAVDTGNVILGTDKSRKVLKIGQAKLVIVSSNCRSEVLEDIRRYSGLANIPVHIFAGDSAELGLACGKPFLVSVLAVLEPGVSNILSLGKTK
ncbi:MAG: 50S ribosomal protein L30e [Candidatus Hadarchaeaceae archaeon]|nr:50S ribosomal protein L30e [Hadesarchaea archaeon]MDH5685375.1 50S ribosomal protein L30e [Hadesarchaea archaeon]